MTAWLVLPGVVISALIVVACICRINLMRYGQNKLGWMVLYIAFAPFAGGMALDLLASPERVEWWDCFGIAGIALHIALTRHHWRTGSPYESRRTP